MAHLLRRAGFGGSRKELDRYEAMGFTGAVEALLNQAPHPDDFPVDASIEELFRSDPMEARMLAAKMLQELAVWWPNRMIQSPNPLEEKLTLFWHGHFTSAGAKVRDGRMMLRQNQLLRRHALANFGDLTQEISRDPAMLVYLDNASNRRGGPNENYARELMELFTMGIGNYSETDVKEAARAFTGWQVNKESASASFNERMHDQGAKTFLGRTGKFQGKDVVDTVVKHPATGPHLARKLFTYFVHENPSEDAIGRLSKKFYESGMSIKAVLRELFNSPEFSSPEAYRAIIKSPAELVAGAFKALGISQADQRAPRIMRLLGQELFNPPSVKGWDGNRAWIGTSTLVSRMNFAGALLNGGGPEEGKTSYAPPPEMVALAAREPERMVEELLDLLVDGEVPESTRSALGEYARKSAKRPESAVRGVVRLSMASPEYQLN